MNMATTSGNKISLVSILFVLLFSAALTVSGCKKSSDSSSQSTPPTNQPTAGTNDNNTGDADTASSNQDVKSADTGWSVPASAQKLFDTGQKLSEILAGKHYWGVTFKQWLGKEAPDFTVTDITGKEFKLSNYHGKNVLIVIWATWCPPCRKEIPHLIELRNSAKADNLEVVGLSFVSPRNTAEQIRQLAQDKNINYTVLPAKPGSVPAPYSEVTGIPSSFFIDPQGRIKLATVGMMSLEDIKAVIGAR